jgi:hypothetical protein
MVRSRSYEIYPPFGYPKTAFKAALFSAILPGLGLILISHRYLKRFLFCFFLGWLAHLYVALNLTIGFIGGIGPLILGVFLLSPLTFPYVFGIIWSYRFGKQAKRIYEETKTKSITEIKSQVNETISQLSLREKFKIRAPAFEEGVRIPPSMQQKITYAWDLHKQGKHDLAILYACIALEGGLRQLYESIVRAEDRAKGYERWTIRNYAEDLRAKKAITEIEKNELLIVHDIRNYVAHYQPEPLREIEDQVPAVIHICKAFIEMIYKKLKRF